jgi:hypothetical protein
MAKLQKLLIINSLSYRWSEMKIPGSESLAKLAVAIKFNFVDPIAVRQIADPERIHWLNQRKVRRSVLFHSLCSIAFVDRI